MRSIRQGRSKLRLLGLLSPAIILMTFGAPDAGAVEQCRFITTNPEREACYQRQEGELSEKKAPPPPRRDATMEALQQMKREDAELDRQIHGICRGC